MNFWWVNQNQTSVHEIDGGYLWSPKSKQNGQRERAYDNMKEIEPGDLIFAYSNMKIGHYGIATGRATSFQKPTEFGKIGMNWSNDGWFVSVKWFQIEPIERNTVGKVAGKIFKEFESPFDINGAVKQRYLFKIDKEAADFVMELARVTEKEFVYESLSLEPSFFVSEGQLDGLVEKQIEQNTEIEQTEKETVIQARRGQGKFRDNLALLENRCRCGGHEIVSPFSGAFPFAS